MISLSKDSFFEKFPISLSGESYKDNRGRLTWGNARYVFSESKRNVFRGLHIDPRYFDSSNFNQVKTIVIIEGSIDEYILCLDEESDDYQKVFTCSLSCGDSFSVPNGYAHGFYALTCCKMLYLIEGSSDIYLNESYTTIALNDSLLGRNVEISSRDLNAKIIV